MFYLILLLFSLPIVFIYYLSSIRGTELYERICKWAANRSEVTVKSERRRKWYHNAEYPQYWIFTRDSENKKQQYRYVAPEETEEQRIRRKNAIIYHESLYDKLLKYITLFIIYFFLIFILILGLPSLICYFHGWSMPILLNTMWVSFWKILYYTNTGLYFLRAANPFKKWRSIVHNIIFYTLSMNIICNFFDCQSNLLLPFFFTSWEEHFLYLLFLFIFYAVYMKFIFWFAKKKLPEFDNYYKCYTKYHLDSIWTKLIISLLISFMLKIYNWFFKRKK